MKKIIGYSHSWLVNHWKEVITEQIKRLVDSGLYDACEAIYCGVIGNNENFQKFMEIIKPYSKIQVSEYSTTPELFEFQTMDILKTHADLSNEDYYLFYIHMKGITYGKDHENKKAFGGGLYWRKHMEMWTIDRWKENVKMLDMGYETCGTQMRVRDWPKHYSGNFFFARSEYVKILRPIQMLDLSDRNSAEFWLLSAAPIAATLSQEYVDYYTPENPNDKLKIFKPHSGFNSPVLKPPTPNVTIKNHEPKIEEKRKVKKKVGRTVVHTLCWAVVSDIEMATRRLYQLNDREDFEHVLVDLSFPLLKADEVPANIQKAKLKNSEALQVLAKKYGSRYVQATNLGVSQNWSTVWKSEKIGDDDVLIGCDPDEMVHPKSTNWVRDMADVIRSGENYGVVSMIMKEQIPTLNETNSINRTIDGIDIIEVDSGAMWAMIGCSGALLNKMGGVPYPVSTPIYGSLESAMMQNMKPLGYKWCFLRDKMVAHPQWNFKHLLRMWKHFILDEKNGEQIHFEDFLKLKQEGKV